MADQVTISTFLELRDNMSEGLRRLSDALAGVTKDSAPVTAAINKTAQQAEAASRRIRQTKTDEERAAEKAARAEARLRKEQEQAAKKLANEQAKAVRAVSAMLREEEQQRERTQRNLLASAERALKERERIAQAEARQMRREAAETERIRVRSVKEQERLAKAEARQMRREAAEAERIRVRSVKEQERLAKAEARQRQREINEELRTASRAAKEQARISARYTKEQERIEARAARAMRLAAEKAAKEKLRIERQVTAAMEHAETRRLAAAERTIREKARLERQAAAAALRETRRVERENERAARHMAATKKKEKPAGLFGTLVGADLTSRAISAAISYGVEGVRKFYESAITIGSAHEKQIAGISGALFTMGIADRFSEAKSQAVSLIDLLRQRAAKMYGETKDYVNVFRLTLRSALGLGMKDVNQYADMVAKYTAIAIQSGYKQQAGYQLNEMLQGHVRVTTNMFQVLKPYMGLTSKEFNAIKNDSQRIQVILNAINEAAGALPAAARDAETIFGTLKSQVEYLSITGQFPLFESMKIAATKLSDILTGPGIGKFISDISTALGDITVGAIVFFKFMFDQASEFVSWIGDKLSGLPGFKSIASTLQAVREITAIADPFSTMMKIGAEERRKWREREDVDMEGKRRPRPHLDFGVTPPAPKTAPSGRPSQNTYFYNNRFDIKQEFAEGFDPDRIAVAFANDLSRLGEMKLQSYTLTGAVR